MLFYFPPFFLRIFWLMVQLLAVTVAALNVTFIHPGMPAQDLAFLSVATLPGLIVLYRWLRRPYQFVQRRIQASRI